MKQKSIPLFVAHYRRIDGAYQSVQTHLEGTAKRASVFAGKIGLSMLGLLIGLLHDIGKYSTAFQEYIKVAIQQAELNINKNTKLVERKKIDHSSAGAKLIWQTSCSPSILSSLARQMAALCVASHHTGTMDCLSSNGEDVFTKRMEKSVDPTCNDIEEEYIRSKITQILMSSAIEDELSNRLEILKDTEQSIVTKAFMIGLLNRFLFSALIDADRLDTADFENQAAASERYNGGYPAWESLIEVISKEHLDK